jgi:hypothetical protein
MEYVKDAATASGVIKMDSSSLHLRKMQLHIMRRGPMFLMTLSRGSFVVGPSSWTTIGGDDGGIANDGILLQVGRGVGLFPKGRYWLPIHGLLVSASDPSDLKNGLQASGGVLTTLDLHF